MNTLLRMILILLLAGRLTAAPVLQQPDLLELAFANHDFLRTLELAKFELLSGSSAKLYCLTGASYFEMKKPEEAKLYLEQAIALKDGDEPYQQTARLYLLQINLAMLSAKSTESIRPHLSDLAKSFSRSSAIPAFFTAEETNRIIIQTQDVLNDISGDWMGPAGYVYRIKQQAKDTFRIDTFRIDISRPKSNGITDYSWGGILTTDGDADTMTRILNGGQLDALAHLESLGRGDRRTFHGTLRYTESLESLRSEMELEVEFRLGLAGDSQSLAGTALYKLNREPVGPAKEVLKQYQPHTDNIVLNRR